MVNLFSLPDEDVLSDSSGTVYLSNPLQGRVVVPVTAIRTVVSMFPEFVAKETGHIETTGKFSLMRYAYAELSQYFTDGLQDLEEEDEEEDQGDNAGNVGSDRL
jgi:hypothetical protein